MNERKTITERQRIGAFVEGWKHGRQHGGASANDALAAHPEYSYTEVDCFCIGSDDGRINDTSRLKEMGVLVMEPGMHKLIDGTEQYLDKRILAY